jgi:unsaturated rhamnogalacturonyl hydrolase
MEHLPPGHAYEGRLQELLLDQVTGISRYQSECGLWRQLPDRVDSFTETSCTAMFTYGIACAVNRGWIPDYYASIAVRAWEALTGHITEEGDFSGVSTGFNIRQDLVYYYRRPLEQLGEHGLGALLLAGSEIRRMKAFRDCLWC